MQVAWDAWQTFVAVLDEGSFSDAADVLEVGQSTVSRRIGQLEEQLGLSLFERSREGALPTASARELADGARRMAEAAVDLRHRLRSGRGEPRGPVRMAVPPGWAVDFIAPRAAEVIAACPEVQFELRSGIEYLDLLAGQADLAVRTEPPRQPGLVELAQVRSSVHVYASASYAAAHARCSLEALDWITWCRPYLHLPPRPQLERWIEDFRPAFAADSFPAQCRAAAAGVGALFLAPEHAAVHRLVRLEVDVPEVRVTTYLLSARSAYQNPAVRAVARVLMDSLERHCRTTESDFLRSPAA